MLLVDQNKILYDKLTRKYDYFKIKQAVQDSISLIEFGAIFDIQEYKYSDNSYYVVVNSTNGYELVLFDSQQIIVNMLDIVFSNFSNYGLISAVMLGDTLNSVLSADDTGSYDFLKVSWTNYPRISYHFFENGVCFSFEYDYEYKVASIWTFTF